MLKFSCTKRLKDWTSRWYNFESSKLAGSKLASLHVCLHSFQCTPDQNNIWLEMYQMKRFINMEHSLCLPVCFCFYQLGLCSVSYTANEYSIYHFSIIIEDFLISFSKSDYCPRLWNYNFLCVICQETSIVLSSYTFPLPNLSVL